MSSDEQVLAGGPAVVYRSSPANDGVAGVPHYYSLSPPATPQKNLAQHKKWHATDNPRLHAIFPHLYSLLVTFLQSPDAVFRHDRRIAKHVDWMLFLVLESSNQIDHSHDFTDITTHAFADQDGLPTEFFFFKADNTDAENHFPKCLAVCIFRCQYEIPDKDQQLKKSEKGKEIVPLHTECRPKRKSA